jgi:hypothetical protein
VPSEEDRVRDSFAAASGIHRTAEGGFTVAASEVKKGPSGEEILKKAADDAKNEESTPNTRSSLASINKFVKPVISPAKPVGVAATALGSRISGIAGVQSKIARPVQSAK